MEDKPHFYKYELKHQLESIIDLHEQDRENYWNEKLGDEEQYILNTAYEQAEDFAEAVLKSAETLLVSENTDNDTKALGKEFRRIKNYPEYFNTASRQIWKSDKTLEEKRSLLFELFQERPVDPEDEASPLRLVWERLYIDLAWNAIDKIDEGTQRIFKLYTLALKTRLCPATQKFLARLGRCYVWGFDSECVILCRAILDTAFRDAVKPEICEKHFGRNREYDFTLNDKIWAAQKEGIIDEKTKDLAIQVKERGVKAVHYQPDITTDVFGTIRDTITVVEKLNSVRKGRAI
jgi:hypothetical protein